GARLAASPGMVVGSWCLCTNRRGHEAARRLAASTKPCASRFALHWRAGAPTACGHGAVGTPPGSLPQHPPTSRARPTSRGADLLPTAVVGQDLEQHLGVAHQVPGLLEVVCHADQDPAPWATPHLLDHQSHEPLHLDLDGSLPQPVHAAGDLDDLLHSVQVM